ncbi:MAG: cyclic nucleotide-binding domain-containing protein [Myxococcales bacterium]|nr:cyclic nucleotide-binding domain-containing protein [Myxococcales bacterium]
MPDGAVVVREGDGDRTMYVILDGVAEARRGDVTLARLLPGQHFGELGMIGGGPRAASVVAVTPLVLGVLTRDAYRELAAADPTAALWLLEAVVSGLGVRLTEVTDSVGALLTERSLPRRTQIRVRIGDEVRQVPTGVTVGSLLARANGDVVVAALIDRRPVSLGTRITSPCTVAPLTSASNDGERILRRGLGLLLLEAARRVDPLVELRLGHSLGVGQRVLVAGRIADELPTLAAALEHEMAALAAADVPMREELWHVDEARERFVEVGWDDAEALLDGWLQPMVPVATFGEVQALALDPPGPDAGALTGARVVANGKELVLMYPPSIVRRSPDDGHVGVARVESDHAAALVSDQERFLASLGVTSVGAFNQACVKGGLTELIRVSEGYHEKRLSAIADRIAGRAGTRIVAIAGPSSSGKTTFIKRLRVQLQVDGIRPHELSLDNYYCDREATPRDEHGEYDYEAFEALRIDLLTEHLRRLAAGDEVATARYDFRTGKSDPTGGRTLRLGPGEIVLLEGIHGLNPRLHAMLPPAAAFAVFVCPLAQLPFDRLSRVHPSDVRLVRRIVRDRHTRNLDAAANIGRWDSVRRGERRHIFPYQHTADVVFDTSLIYELSVLKIYAQRYLLEVPHDHPSYTTAFRLLRLLDRFVPIYSDHVPPTSILREFIGGGGFEY